MGSMYEVRKCHRQWLEALFLLPFLPMPPSTFDHTASPFP